MTAWVPRFGPWFMTYRPGSPRLGVLLVADNVGSGRGNGWGDVVLSGGWHRHGLIVGWRFRRPLRWLRKSIRKQVVF